MDVSTVTDVVDSLSQAHGDQVGDDNVYDLFERISLDTLPPGGEVCPLSRQAVNNPVRTHRCGHIFEEAALIEYIKTKILRPILCPECHVPMRVLAEEVERSERATTEVECMRKAVKVERGGIREGRKAEEAFKEEIRAREVAKNGREVEKILLEINRVLAGERVAQLVWNAKEAMREERSAGPAKDSEELVKTLKKEGAEMLRAAKEKAKEMEGEIEAIEEAQVKLKRAGKIQGKVREAIEAMCELAHALASDGKEAREPVESARERVEWARGVIRGRRFQIKEQIEIFNLFKASLHPEYEKSLMPKIEITALVRACCGHVFEQGTLIRQILTSGPLRLCPECHTPMNAAVEPKGGIEERILEELGVVCDLFEQVNLDALSPRNRVCPLSKKEMRNPVRTRECGHVFEEEDLINYMKRQGAQWSITCPACSMSMKIVEELEAKRLRERVEKAREVVNLREQMAWALEVEMAVAVAAEIRKAPARAGEDARKEEIMRAIQGLEAEEMRLVAEITGRREVERISKVERAMEVERAREVLAARRAEKGEEAGVYAFFECINPDTRPVDVVASDERVCPITLEKMDTPVKLHGCAHVFEEIEYMKWIMVSGAQLGSPCPMCRRLAKAKCEVEEMAAETEKAKTKGHRGKKKHKGRSRGR